MKSSKPKEKTISEGRRQLSPEARQRIAAMQRERWAAKTKQASAVASPSPGGEGRGEGVRSTHTHSSPSPGGEGRGERSTAQLTSLPVAPNKDRDLRLLEIVGAKLQARIRKKSIDLVYDIVEFGLVLLKAKDTHQCATVARRLDDGTLGEADGYHTWLETNFPDIKIRTAQNYANAALNAGLTPGSDLKAVARLRKEKLLHDKSPTDLYRAPKLLTDIPSPGGEGQGEGESYNLVRDTLKSLGAECDAIVKLRNELSGDQFEVVVTRLQDTLQLLTGTKWDQVDSEVVDV